MYPNISVLDNEQSNFFLPCSSGDFGCQSRLHAQQRRIACTRTCMRRMARTTTASTARCFGALTVSRAIIFFLPTRCQAARSTHTTRTGRCMPARDRGLTICRIVCYYCFRRPLRDGDRRERRQLHRRIALIATQN